MEKDKVYKNILIKEVDINGNGITRIENIVVFINNAILNENVDIKIKSIEKNYAIAEIYKINKKSNQRKTNECPYKLCGGCSFLHAKLNYENQIKKEYIEKVIDKPIDKYICSNEYNYRNKVTFHVENNKIGYYEEKTNNLIKIENCLILENQINNILKLMQKMDLSDITEIIIRKSYANNEIMVKTKGELKNEDILEIIKEETNVKSLYFDDKLIYGNEYIIEEFDDYKFSIFPESFFQVNTKTTKELYDIIKEYAGSGNKLLDLYCGTGSIGIYLSNKYKEIVGIEKNKYSVKNAKINIKINKVNNVKIIKGDANVLIDDFDTIIVDPPRKGLSKKVLDNIEKMNPTKIIYVSCNPKSLNKDLKELKNYAIKKYSAVNMFPKTKHLETVVLLTKINK